MFPYHRILKADWAGDTLVVRPCADGIGFRYADLQTELNRILRAIDVPEDNQPVSHVVIDLGDLAYCGQEVLASIVSLLNRVAARGGRAVWCNGSSEMREFLDERGVASLWPYFDSCDEALSAVAAA